MVPPSDGSAIAKSVHTGTLGETPVRLRDYVFFKGFPEKYLDILESLVKEERLPSDTDLLKEGEVNDCLFFLASGRVAVKMDGERIATLDRPGDLLGEMSVITNRPVSATICSDTPVTFFKIKKEDLDRVASGAEDDFHHALFRTYSMILSEKLVITNDKARRFEIANREILRAKEMLERANIDLEKKVATRTADLVQQTKTLEKTNIALEQQNEEIMASHRKLEELYTGKELTFRKLTELRDNSLEPLQKTLLEVMLLAQDDVRKKVAQAQREVDQALNLLRPLAQLYSAEQAVKSKRVLLAESDRKQQVVAKLALGGTGVQLDIANTLEEATAALDSATYDLIFTSTDLVDVAKLAHERNAKTKLVLMTSTDIKSYLPQLHQHSYFHNIVSRDADDRTFTVKNIATTVNKLVSRDLFGLEKYLIWGVEVKSASIRRSDERAGLIEKMQEYFQEMGLRSRIIERCAAVAEEMLMNAIYDAPVGPDGEPLFNHKDRRELIELEAVQFGEFRYACDGMLAGISVGDPFGAFKMQILMKYLSENYGSESVQAHEGKGGAGKGLHQIIENSDLVVFNVNQGRKTEVIALFNLEVQKSGDGERQPSFHFFMD